MTFARLSSPTFSCSGCWCFSVNMNTNSTRRTPLSSCAIFSCSCYHFYSLHQEDILIVLENTYVAYQDLIAVSNETQLSWDPIPQHLYKSGKHLVRIILVCQIVFSQPSEMIESCISLMNIPSRTQGFDRSLHVHSVFVAKC